ncbi:DNA-binding GntR family transcriptional regulator [Catenulispora sp. MAP5-51]|uniref:FCD domain-containing protein n=1 Tax=Catenulispora sp. MAP5-51 TaxID=3156298 RepID=UPI0035145ADF
MALADDALAAGRLEELARLNSRFHEVLAQASGSRTLTELITQLRWKMEWVYTAKLPRRAQDSWREHREIVEVLESGDPDKAARVVVRHIARGRDVHKEQ